MNPPLRVEYKRSGVVESVHEADCVLVDGGGSLLASAGEPSRVAYFRSAAKPIQAAVCLANGWEPAEDRHLAVACGSHSGEPAHLDAVREVLAAADLDEETLRCPPAPTRIAHNCSGKHAAMLATCVARGWPVDSYLSPAHPLQRAVLERIAALSASSPVVGVDGCGVPTFALPLTAIARGFASLASDDAPLRRVATAMRAHPFYVAGTNRVCTELMTSLPDAIAKVGAEGLGCVCYEGRAVCFKVRDGAARAREALMAAVLEIAGLVDRLPPSLAAIASPLVKGGESAAGQSRVQGSLG